LPARAGPEGSALETIGGQIGPYVIERELGRGGMGVVYLATDSRLDREVAIKALPVELAADPLRLERFEREAKTLAQVNHPHIAGIHGVEEAEGRRYLVLEYVEGETLADRLDRGVIAPDEAVEIAGQIAAGVAAAHDAGVIHRDLKPANIRLTPDGVAKVLDFGLARQDEGQSATGSSTTEAETLTTPVQHSPTEAGVILGTAAYMSPEQARGRRVDKRTDIWSFGVVLYEMLTGSSPFVGETATDSIGAILHKDPDLDRLPASCPAGLRRVLARCLERDKSRRYRDIGDVRIELELAMQEPATAASGTSAGKVIATAAVAAVLAGGIGLGAGGFGKPDGLKRDLHLALAGPPEHRVFGGQISPDGQRVIFGAVPIDGGASVGYERRLDDHEPRVIEQTRIGGGREPRFSPDAQWMSFITPVGATGSAMQLTKTRLDSDLPPAPLAVLPESMAVSGYNNLWLGSDRFVFSNARRAEIVFVDAESGSMSEPITIDLGGYPGMYEEMLDRVDNTHALCRLSRYTDRGYQTDIGLLDVEAASMRVILENSGEARIAPDGSLLFTRGATLYGCTFDRATMQLGPATQLVSGLRTPGPAQDAVFDVSDDGTLLFSPGGEQGAFRKLQIKDSQGNPTDIDVEPRSYTQAVTVSYDESRLLTVVAAPNKLFEIWGTELDEPRMRRIRGYPDADLNYPVFAGDNDTFVYMRSVGETTGIEAASFDGHFEPYWVFEPQNDGFLAPLSVHPTRNTVLALWEKPEGFRNYEFELKENAEARPILDNGSNIFFSDYSPDGSMLAYTSDETGRREAYVRSIDPDDGTFGRAVPVTSRGGSGVVWYHDPDPGDPESDGVAHLAVSSRGGVVMYPITPGDRPRIGEPVEMSYDAGIGFGDALSGGRVLLIQPGDNEYDSLHLEVIVNWYDNAAKLIRSGS